MMNLLFRGALVAAFLGGTAGAALPPDAQRRMEEDAARAAAGALPQMGAPTQVEFVSVDLYRVASARCSVDVRIISLPMPVNANGVPIVGPRNFRAEPGRPACR